MRKETSRRIGHRCIAWFPVIMALTLLCASLAGLDVSPPAEATTPRLPAAPTHVSAAPRNAGAKISWSTPSSNGAIPITSYTVRVGPKTCITQGLSCEVPGLSNGKIYQVTVTATNKNGVGPPSASIQVTPGVPAPPTNVSAAWATAAAASVRWTSGSTNGSAILSYTVTASPGGKTATTGGSKLALTIGGLVDGGRYTFSVKASNSNGTSTSSGPSAPFTLSEVIVNGCAIFPGADLRGCHLWHADLGHLDLSGADLTGDNLATANLGSANLTSADLTDCNLTYTNFAKANLTNTTLTGTGGALNGVTSGGITGTPKSLPSDWELADGYLVGPGANLTGANLTNANLSGADLTGVSSGGMTGAPSELPSGWQLIGGYLVGPGANLTDADLANFDLGGADLAGADLHGADLSFSGLNANLGSADLTDANLSSADLSSAILTGAIWSNTTCPDGTNSDADGNTCVNNETIPEPVSNPQARANLMQALAVANAAYAESGDSFTGVTPAVLGGADPGVNFTNQNSTGPSLISLKVSTDGNGLILAAEAPPDNCWYIYDNQVTVTSTSDAPWGSPPTGTIDVVDQIFVTTNIVVPSLNPYTYYAEVGSDALAGDCNASQPMARPGSVYAFQTRGFPLL